MRVLVLALLLFSVAFAQVAIGPATVFDSSAYPTTPLTDAGVLDDFFARCAAFPACARGYGIDGGGTVHTFDLMISQLPVADRPTTIDGQFAAFIDGKTAAEVAAEFAVIMATVNNNLYSCSQGETYVPSTRSCSPNRDATLNTCVQEHSLEIILGVTIVALLLIIIIKGFINSIRK